MDLLTFVGALSSFTGLKSWMSEKIDQFKKDNLHNKIININDDFRENHLNSFNNKFIEEKLDEYLCTKFDNFTMLDMINLFSIEERNNVVENFFKKNNQLLMYKENINLIINQYLDKLNHYINTLLNPRDKIIIKVVEQSSKSIIQEIQGINKKSEAINIYKNNEKIKKIINECNLINSSIQKNLDIKFLNYYIDLNYISGSTLDEIMMRIRMLFENLNKDGFNNISKSNRSNPIDAFFDMIKFIAQDFSTKLDEYYYKMKPVIQCVNNFTFKNDLYYLSLGALGLFEDNSEERIFNVVINNILEFFIQSNKIFNELWKDRDYKNLEYKAINTMNKHLLSKIKYVINEENIEFIKYIYKNKKTLDIELSEKFSFDINKLRKSLFYCTEVFLNYKYNNNYSTELSINGSYIDVFEKYYKEIFGEKLYED
ncbi:MAG: hypothetical protein KH415_03360 [Clostridium sp.]|nr:hypothetical protein [Clostridium sp.]